MNPKITPNLMWQMRYDALGKDIERVKILLEEELDVKDPSIGGGINLLLSDLISSFRLVQQPQAEGDSKGAWDDITKLRRKFWRVFASQLELLGGVGLARGLSETGSGVDRHFSNRSQEWLTRLIGPLGLKSDPIVIPGRGPLLKLDSRKPPKIVVLRAPFLDWDLWYRPLLGRAIGLLAAVEDPNGLLEPAIEQILSQANDLFAGPAFSTSNEKVNADRQEKYLRYLYADMYSTAVLGPVYALPVFVLELDYASPEAYSLGDPDQIERRDTAARYLPSAVDRAVVILATLKQMDLLLEKRFYQSATEVLERLWGEVENASGKPGLLAAKRQRFDASFKLLFEKAVFPTVATRLPGTQEDWQYALDWYERLCSKEEPRPQALESKHPAVDMETQLLGAMWWHRLHHPAKAKFVHRAVDDFLNAGEDITPYHGGKKPSLSNLSAGSRLTQMDDRQTSLQHFFAEGRSDEGGNVQAGERIIERKERQKVVGRFHRLMSPQIYMLDECRQLLADGNAPAEAWEMLAEIEQNAQSLHREALEFFGGLLLRYRGLDREPAEIAIDQEGPGVCELADDLLARLSIRTGVDWNALTVPGPSTFHAGKTDIIRVRFPDWSLWSLPLMAHEFGHGASRTIRQLQIYQGDEAIIKAREAAPNRKTDPQHKKIFEQVYWRTKDHLEEFFCDVFATYVLGPAFALNAVLLEFYPTEAYTQSSSHPSAMERVQVITQTLCAMGEEFNAKSYRELGQDLWRIWTKMVMSCQAKPKDKNKFNDKLSQAGEWGEELFKIVAQTFRLGAGYTADRWQNSQKMAERMVKPPPAKLADLHAIAQEKSGQRFFLKDILNALWWARVNVTGDTHAQSRLSALAYDLGSEYSKG